MIDGINVLGYGDIEPERSITDIILSVAGIIVLYLALLPAGITNTVIVMFELLMILWYKSTGFLSAQIILISSIAFILSAYIMIGGSKSTLTRWLFNFSGTSQIAILIITILVFISVMVVWVFANARNTASVVLAFAIAALVAFQTVNVEYTIYNIQEQFSNVGFTQEYYDYTAREIHAKVNEQSDLLSLPATVAVNYMLGIEATESWAVFNEFVAGHGSYDEILAIAEKDNREPDKVLHDVLSYANKSEFPYEEFLKTTYAVKEIQMECNINDIPFSKITVTGPTTLSRIVSDTVAHPASFNWERTTGQFNWSAVPSYIITYKIAPNTLKLYTEEEFNQIDRDTYENSSVYIKWATEQYSSNIK